MRQKAFLPLVAGLGTDPILPTQISKVLCPQGSQHKLRSLIHRLLFFPWHPQLLANSLQRCYPCLEPGPHPKSSRTGTALPVGGKSGAKSQGGGPPHPNPSPLAEREARLREQRFANS